MTRTKIIITIPEVFKLEYEKDKFKETSERVIVDLEDNINKYKYGFGLAGNYELEKLRMLLEEFGNSTLQEKENEKER